MPDAGGLPDREQLAGVERRIEGDLLDQGVTADVSLTAVGLGYLRWLPPHIFGYELQLTGRVLWGDATILRQIPPIHRQQIPAEDAWRLLANRILELLPTALAGRAKASWSPEDAYPWVKLHLDMATSYLVFRGAYAPTYTARAGRLRAPEHQGKSVV